MSTKKQPRPIRALQGILGYVLALLLAVSLAGACGLTLMNRLLTDQALHERVAQNERVLDAQMERVEGSIRMLAEKYHFAPESVLGVDIKGSLEAYGREMVAWWMGLMGERPDTEAPFPDTRAMEEAIRVDELFCESTEDFMRRTIARDEIAYPIGLAMREAVTPLRISLFSLAMPMITARVDIPSLISLLGTAQTGLFALSAVLLILVLVTQGKRRFLLSSAGLLAAFVLLAAMTAAVAAADLPGAMAEYSSMLSLQLGILLRELTAPVLLAEGVLLLAAVLMMLPVALKREKAYRGQHERKEP